MRKKIIKSISLVLLGILMFMFNNIRIPFLDSKTDRYFSEAIQKAGLAYATVRVLNASLSIIKNSEVQLEPGGVGLSIAAGEIVDPIDDMTERLSDVLVTAIASLGVQKLFYEIGVSVVPYFIAVLLLLFSLLIWVEKQYYEKIKHYLISAAIILMAARFFLPISSYGNDFIYSNYLLEDIVEARKELTIITKEIKNLHDIELPEINGITETIKNSASFLSKTTNNLKESILVISHNVGEIINNLLKLTWLYVAVFFIQVIAFPIFMFWLLVKLANALLSFNFSDNIKQ